MFIDVGMVTVYIFVIHIVPLQCLSTSSTAGANVTPYRGTELRRLGKNRKIR